MCTIWKRVLPGLQTPAPHRGEHQGRHSSILILMFLRYSKYKYFLLTALHTCRAARLCTLHVTSSTPAPRRDPPLAGLAISTVPLPILLSPSPLLWDIRAPQRSLGTLEGPRCPLLPGRGAQQGKWDVGRPSLSWSDCVPSAQRVSMCGWSSVNRPSTGAHSAALGRQTCSATMV